MLSVLLLTSCAASGAEHSATFGAPTPTRPPSDRNGVEIYTCTAPAGETCGPGPAARSASSPAPRETNAYPTPARRHKRPPPPDAALIAPYAWAESYRRDSIANAAAFTLVKGIGPRAALRILDPHPALPATSPQRVDRWIDQRFTVSSSHYFQAIYAGRRDGWTFVLEDNGFRATERAARLSRQGAAVVIFNNVDSDCSFQYAVQGRTVREFDPSFYDMVRGRPLPQEQGIAFGHDWRYISRSMLLAHRLTGLDLTPADVQPGRYDLAVATRY